MKKHYGGIVEEDLVSVGIPAYNHENYIQETIRSIINQTYKNIELIILDDGSTDKTWEKILELEDECKKRFTNIHFEKQKNIGCTKTNAKLISLATGKYYMIIASDDLAKPNAIEIEYEFLKNNPDYILCAGDNDLIDSSSNVIAMDENRHVATRRSKFIFYTHVEHSAYDLSRSFQDDYAKRCDWRKVEAITYADLWRGNKIPNVGLYRLDLLKQVDLNNPMYPIDDWAIHIQLLKIGKYKVLPDILGTYRIHENQQIKNNDKLILDIRTIQFYEIYRLETEYPEYLTDELYENWWFRALKNKFDKTKNSIYWDEKYYLNKYPEVLETGYLPIVHYLTNGIYNGYLPCEKFEKFNKDFKNVNLAIEGHKYFTQTQSKLLMSRLFGLKLFGLRLCDIKTISPGNYNIYLLSIPFLSVRTNEKDTNINFLILQRLYAKIKNYRNRILEKNKFEEKTKILEKNKISRNAIINKFKNGEKITIALLTSRPGMWNFDSLYNILNKDNRFDVKIVVMPDPYQGEETMIHYLVKTLKELRNKGYEPISGFDLNTHKVLDFKNKINPDIIFYSDFWKPHFFNEFYITNFLDKITMLNDYGFNVMQENKVVVFELNNMVDLYFRQTYFHKKMAIPLMKNRGNNIRIVGSPKIESFFDKDYEPINPWKMQNSIKKKIIWAPHYNKMTSKDMYCCNAFWEIYNAMLEIADIYADQIQIAFRPHPMLKQNLYKEWGRHRTNLYFNEWQTRENTQVFEDEFIDLFLTSDAMIMDSCSFLAEYTAVNKPLFYTSTKTSRLNLNEFGKEIFENVYSTSNNLTLDIEHFIQDVVINGNDYKKEERTEFVKQYFGKINDKTASENIYDEIIKFLEKGEV